MRARAFIGIVALDAAVACGGQIAGNGAGADGAIDVTPEATMRDAGSGTDRAPPSEAGSSEDVAARDAAVRDDGPQLDASEIADSDIEASAPTDSGRDAALEGFDATDGTLEASLDAAIDATSESGDAGTDAPRDAAPDVSTLEASVDGAPSDAPRVDAPAPDSAACLSWALGGIGVPPGTIAIGSTTYSTYVAANAVDGDLSTNWNAFDFTATLNLAFPAAVAITGVRLAATSLPATNETYTITPAGMATVIGNGTNFVNGNTTYTVEPGIAVTPGSYTGLNIAVDGMSSWVAISEVSLLTAACP